MRTMLQELVTTGSAAFETSAARSSALDCAVASRLEVGVTALTAAQSAIQQSGAQHHQAVSALAQSSSDRFTVDMQVASAQRLTADSTLASVSGAVGAKRKFLDSTVTELCSHVDVAIQQGVTVVNSTSATASKVLSDVSAASQAMDASASASMDAFTSFMDQEGEALSEGLKAHFGMVASHAGAQSAGLAALHKEAGAHGEAMQAARLLTTGTTPRKVQRANFEGPFKRTRSHVAIRDQARDGVLRAQPVPEDAEGPARAVSYEVARSGIAHCAENACSADDAAEDPVMDFATETVASVIPATGSADDEAAALTASVGRTSSASTGSSKSHSSRASKDSTESATSEVEIDVEGGFMENANPNITNTRSSRGATGKSKSKIATLGSRSNRSSAFTDAI
jgi:hypothetical protein